MQTISALFRPLLRPAAYFADPPASAWRTALIAVAATAAVLALASAAAAWANMDALRMNNLETNRAALEQSVTAAIQPVADPVDRLLFPLYWALIFAAGFGLRWGLLRLIREETVAVGRVAALTLFAGWPLLFTAGLMNFLNDLFPFNTFAGLAAAARIWGILLLLLGAFVWEGIVFIRGGRQALSLPRGLAVVVWLAPLLVSGFLCGSFLFVAVALA